MMIIAAGDKISVTKSLRLELPREYVRQNLESANSICTAIITTMAEMIRQLIDRCFELIRLDDAKLFRRKFRQLKNDPHQRMDFFRELVIGGYLASQGLLPRYELEIDQSKPDWSTWNSSNFLAAIIEVKSFHADDNTQQELNAQFARGPFAAYWGPSNTTRLQRVLREKASKKSYIKIAQTRNIPYVICLHGGFMANVTQTELYEVLFDINEGIFINHHRVSGVLYFQDAGSGYHLNYVSNPYASRTFTLQGSVLSLDGFRLVTHQENL